MQAKLKSWRRLGEDFVTKMSWWRHWSNIEQCYLKAAVAAKIDKNSRMVELLIDNKPNTFYVLDNVTHKITTAKAVLKKNHDQTKTLETGGL